MLPQPEQETGSDLSEEVKDLGDSRTQTLARTGPPQLAQPEPHRGPGPDLGPEPLPGPEPDLGPVLVPCPRPEPVPGPGSDPGPEPVPESGPDTGPDPGPEPIPGPEPDPEPHIVPEPGPGPEPDTVPGLEPGPGPEPGPDLKADRGQSSVVLMQQDLGFLTLTFSTLSEAPPPGLEPATEPNSSVLQVTAGSRTRHFVSYRRGEFVQMRFPKYSLPKVSTPDPNPDPGPALTQPWNQV